jgi:hypothetical protein
MILPIAAALALASSSGGACYPQIATPTTIEAVQGRFDAWRGRCVRLRGLFVSGSLYVDRQATLDPTAVYGEGSEHSIVVFPNEASKPNRAAWVEILGRIGSCADQNAVLRRWIDAHPDGGIWMISGYCHVSMANYVDPVSIRRLGREPVLRLTEAEVPAERRQLVEAPPAIAGRARNEAVARALAEAIESADEAGFLRYVHPETRSDLDKLHGARLPRWLREDLAKAHAEFLAAIRGSPFRSLGPLEGRQERIFVEPGSLADLSAEPVYLVCWCRESDCTSRWPVARRDADNDPSRPYACVETSEYSLSDGGDAVSATAELPSDGFAEPAWPRRPE